MREFEDIGTRHGIPLEVIRAFLPMLREYGGVRTEQLVNLLERRETRRARLERERGERERVERERVEREEERLRREAEEEEEGEGGEEEEEEEEPPWDPASPFNPEEDLEGLTLDQLVRRTWRVRREWNRVYRRFNAVGTEYGIQFSEAPLFELIRRMNVEIAVQYLFLNMMFTLMADVPDDAYVGVTVRHPALRSDIWHRLVRKADFDVGTLLASIAAAMQSDEEVTLDDDWTILLHVIDNPGVSAPIC